jgi:hypothetical protein
MTRPHPKPPQSEEEPNTAGTSQVILGDVIVTSNEPLAVVKRNALSLIKNPIVKIHLSLYQVRRLSGTVPSYT